MCIRDSSIEVASKIAKALDISLDYLVGNSSTSFKDSKAIQRLEDIYNMPSEEQNQIFKVVDALIRDYKAKQAYQ